MNDPLISIIVPTYNSSKTLEACLSSIKNQTYKNIELIVVDNNSNDRTKEIARNFTDKVLNCVFERSAQRNFGVVNSKGDYLLFVDSDMELSGEVTEKCFNKILVNNNVKGIVIPEESFGEGFWSKCKKLERSFYSGINWIEAARFFDKQTFVKVGGYDEKLISGEDWDLSQRVAEIGVVRRIDGLILHNEGKLSLSKTARKKFFYAKHFAKYISKNIKHNNVRKQIGIFSRYKLFFNQPKKLFKNPLVGFGMLFMKTYEFFFGGVGYFLGRIKKQS